MTKDKNVTRLDD